MLDSRVELARCRVVFQLVAWAAPAWLLLAVRVRVACRSPTFEPSPLHPAPCSQVERYKALLLKQRDIMIALTQRLNERDEQILALQAELEAYDTHQK